MCVSVCVSMCVLVRSSTCVFVCVCVCVVPQGVRGQPAGLRGLPGPVPVHPAGHEPEQQGGVPAARRAPPLRRDGPGGAAQRHQEQPR